MLSQPRLHVIKSLPAGAVGAEIGVHEGDFSAHIIKNSNPRKLYLVDPWSFQPDYDKSYFGRSSVNQDIMDRRYDGVCERFKGEIGRGTVEIIRKGSVDAAPDVSDNSLDFIYIDGLHAYEGVKGDLNAWYPKMKTGALIIGDDYVVGNWWKDGIVRAFNEFMYEKNLPIAFKVGNQIALVNQPFR